MNLNKFSKFISSLNEIPEISASINSDSKSAVVNIQNHPPLNNVNIVLESKKYFWSENLNLVWTVEEECDKEDFDIDINDKDSYWFKKIFENNELLSLKMSSIDTLRFKIKVQNHQLRIEFVPIIGSFVSLLIPPVTYQVPISLQEAVVILEILQIVLSEVLN